MSVSKWREAQKFVRTFWPEATIIKRNMVNPKLNALFQAYSWQNSLELLPDTENVRFYVVMTYPKFGRDYLGGSCISPERAWIYSSELLQTEILADLTK